MMRKAPQRNFIPMSKPSMSRMSRVFRLWLWRHNIHEANTVRVVLVEYMALFAKDAERGFVMCTRVSRISKNCIPMLDNSVLYWKGESFDRNRGSLLMRGTSSYNSVRQVLTRNAFERFLFWLELIVLSRWPLHQHLCLLFF
jgi:hypothetical protein